jgi:hypothetical protein
MGDRHRPEWPIGLAGIRTELKKLLAEATESGEEKPEAKLEGARALPGHRGEEEHDADPVACPCPSAQRHW